MAAMLNNKFVIGEGKSGVIVVHLPLGSWNVLEL
jgi:hypothetical protein